MLISQLANAVIKLYSNNSLDVSCCKIIETTDSLNIKICNQLCIKLKVVKQHSYMLVDKKYLPDNLSLNVTSRASETPRVRILISSIDEIIQLNDILLKIYYESSTPTFSCCSSYQECSDNKGCIKTNDPFYLQCYYRKHLQQGRIFYGKNKNI